VEGHAFGDKKDHFHEDLGGFFEACYDLFPDCT
jgi:hypothetical protein